MTADPQANELLGKAKGILIVPNYLQAALRHGRISDWRLRPSRAEKHPPWAQLLVFTAACLAVIVS
jgi:hypothetical protein